MVWMLEPELAPRIAELLVLGMCSCKALLYSASGTLTVRRRPSQEPAHGLRRPSAGETFAGHGLELQGAPAS